MFTGMHQTFLSYGDVVHAFIYLNMLNSELFIWQPQRHGWTVHPIWQQQYGSTYELKTHKTKMHIKLPCLTGITSRNLVGPYHYTISLPCFVKVSGLN